MAMLKCVFSSKTFMITINIDIKHMLVVLQSCPGILLPGSTSA